MEPEITSDTAAQFYDVRSPTGETVITRRRLTTSLGVSAYDLYADEDPRGPSVTFRARLRYDADYGGDAAATTPTSARLVPGFDRGPVDLMYGYVEGRRFLKGWLGFKLGRQYVVDALGWWSFDGGEVKITAPRYVALELFGGLEQRGGMPFSTPRFERDGVWRGDRSGYDPSVYPSFQPSDVAPAYGAALESTGSNWLHSRLTYRRVYNTGGSNVTQFASGTTAPFAYRGSRISSERVGWGFDGTLPKAGGVKGGLQYDVYNAKIANVFASVDAYVGKRLTLSLDYEYAVPTFDADSIWNFFLAMPMNDLGLRASYDASDHWALGGGVRARAFGVQTAPETGLTEPTSPNALTTQSYYPAGSLDVMGGGDVSARWHFGEGSVGVRANADVARTGDRIGADLQAERTLETRFLLSARTGVWQWSDDQREGRDATSFQYVVGAGYKLRSRSLVYVDFEHDMNRLAGHRLRGMLWLSVAVTK
ncbi:MAG: hypothetical protein JWP97_6141 [Labilithrix sp.]|nr:hypothetical protein [Labilithrix sp.]